MDLILEGILKAFHLLFTLDPEVLGITLLSLQVSGTATLISLFIGISIGTLVALTEFPGRRLVVSLINTGMGLPPVVVGLFVTIFLWRNGPLGFLEILYTPAAMILAQAVIATPIVMGITLAAIQALPRNLRLQILALGATRLQMVWILVKEARLPLLAGVMAGFGGVISEVGASIMVGGNIKGYSRVLDDCHGHGDEPGKLRHRHRARDHSPPPCVPRQPRPYPRPAARKAEMNASPILEAKDLRVLKGGALVLDIPALTIGRGEILSLIGPNGAGKTTLLQTLSSLVRLSGGEILFNGQRISSRGDLFRYRRKLAMVFQEPLLFDTTVFDNVASGLKIRGLKGREISKRVKENLERFGIPHLESRSARKISGGKPNG